MILAGLALCALVFNGTQLIWVVFAFWPDRGGVRLFVGVHQPAYPWRPGRDERTIGGAGIATVRVTGAAAGSAMAAAVATCRGSPMGSPPGGEQGRRLGVRRRLPLAGLACTTAWRRGSPRLNATTTE